MYVMAFISGFKEGNLLNAFLGQVTPYFHLKAVLWDSLVLNQRQYFCLCLIKTQKHRKLIHEQLQALRFILFRSLIYNQQAASTRNMFALFAYINVYLKNVNLNNSQTILNISNHPYGLMIHCWSSLTPSVSLHAGEHLAQLVFRSENSASLWSLKAIHAMCEMEQSRVRSDLYTFISLIIIFC